MKLAARDIEPFLRKPDASVQAALLYGPDSGLVRARAKQIIAAVLGENFDPFNLCELTGEQLKSDPARLRDELCAMSLMGGRRLVLVRDAGEKIAGIIEEAFEGVSTTTYLVVEVDELAASSSLRQLFEKNGGFASLACYREEGRNLEETIRAGLAKHQLKPTPDALHYLLDQLGNDRGITESELTKLALYMDKDKEVTLEIAAELTGGNAVESLEDMCHAVASGQSGEVSRLLDHLLREGEQPVAILRALIRHFQRLDLAAAHMATGLPVDQAIAQLRPPVFFKYAPVMKREISRWPQRSLAAALTLFLRAEKDVKSSLTSPALLLSHTVQQVARLA